MTDIQLTYINLDRATQRREMLERSFAASGFSSRWSLHRFAAVSAESEQVLAQPGKLSGAYKGNYFSHVGCVRQSVGTDAHLFVAEDDLQFCNQTGPILEDIVDSLPEDSWDIIRTEISLLSAVDYPRIYKLSVGSFTRGKVKLLDLTGFDYAHTGSSAYVVNRRAKQKFVHMLEGMLKLSEGRMDLPFDISLREVIRHRMLAGLLTVPFLTAPSIHADESQAPFVNSGQQEPGDEMKRFNQTFLELMTAFRRTVWIGFDANAVLPPQFAPGDALFSLTQQDMLYQKIASWMMFMQANVPYDTDFPGYNFLAQDFPRRQ